MTQAAIILTTESYFLPVQRYTFAIHVKVTKLFLKLNKRNTTVDILKFFHKKVCIHVVNIHKYLVHETLNIYYAINLNVTSPTEHYTSANS